MNNLYHTLSPDEIKQLSESDWQERLSPEEYHILRQKGTERPFTGLYTDSTEAGVYRCKACHAELFSSADKFHSGCGGQALIRPFTHKQLVNIWTHHMECAALKSPATIAAAIWGTFFRTAPKKPQGYAIALIHWHWYLIHQQRVNHEFIQTFIHTAPLT